jgi:multiple antibiotic resistance protein
MHVARALPPTMQRKIAWRTVLVGFIVAVLLLTLGSRIVGSFHLSQAVLVMAVGVTNFILAIPRLLSGPGDASTQTHNVDPLGLAISPLAVPSLISPVAVALFLSVDAFEPNLTSTLTFFGIVLVLLLIDLGVMLLSTKVARYLTTPILEVFRKIFGFILLTFGIQVILLALQMGGLRLAPGF